MLVGERPSIPLSGPAFPKSEYDRRHHKVFEAMAKAKLDALVVTALGHNKYLTGYHGFGAYFAPFPLILIPGRAPIYVVREYEVQAVQAETYVAEVIPYTQQYEFGKACADVLRQLGLQRATVGFELGCWNLAVNDLNAVRVELPDMRVVDGSRIVALAAAVKGDLEIDAMRKSMAMTDIAVRTFQGTIRDGATEAQVARSIAAEVEKVGGVVREPYTLVFGERTKMPHGGPLHHPIKANQPAMIETGVWYRGYAAGLVRSAVLGRHPETESIHALAEEALEAAISAIKPGVTAGEVDAAGRKIIEKSKFPKSFRHRTGYQTGINWTERGNISLEPDSRDVLEVGATVHMPFILFSEHGYLFGTSENVLVTQAGSEILSRTPHTLHRA